MVTFVGFGLYTWTAIHSGWSDFGMQVFGVASMVVPPVLGLVADWVAHRITGRAGRQNIQ